MGSLQCGVPIDGYCFVKADETKSQLWTRLSGFGAIVAVVAFLSALVNVLALTGALYMLQVYDRVLTSHSVPTLVALSILTLVLYAFQGLLDVLRAQILVRLAARVDARLLEPAYQATLRLPLYGRSSAEAMNPLRDVDAIRAFVSGQSLIAILDLPWLPIYLAFVFALHVSLGWVTLAGAGALIALALVTERALRSLNLQGTKTGTRRLSLAEAQSRNAEVLKAMGLGKRAYVRFRAAHLAHQVPTDAASDRAALLGGISKMLRLVLQSAILGLGAYLALRGEISSGAIIAASIAASRALAPIEVAIGNWRAFVAAHQSYTRLEKTLGALPTTVAPMALPAPRSRIALEGVTVPIPGTTRVVLSDISFELKAGQGLAVIGPSAAGKSSLVRALAGVWPLARGAVRLDGATLDRWSDEALAHHVGYLPQDVELFEGSIKDNIARFEEQPDPSGVITAANAAGIHEMILRMPEGYETNVGPAGMALSAGQRQRVALARALYRDPFLVILDEPNSNLDAEGDEALTAAIKAVRSRGGIVVVVAHRPGILAAVDTVAVITAGRLTGFGPRDEVMRKAVRGSEPAPLPSSVGHVRGSIK